MIAAIDFTDVDDMASATPLVNGVVFRLPFSFGTGSMMLASRGCRSMPPSNLRDISLAEFERQTTAYDFVGYRGCDRLFHYFAMPDCLGIRLPIQQLSVRQLPILLGFWMLVSFRRGRQTIPDPRVMLDIQPESCKWALDW